PGDVISSVWPSGSALATTSAPILPPAPGRFSTMTGWPRVLASSSPTARASTSTSPPAGNAAIMRMAFVGHACAPPAHATAAANAAARLRNAANVRGNNRMTPSACRRLGAGHGRVHARRRRAHVHAFARRFSHESYHQMALELDKLRLFDSRNVMLAGLYRAALLTPGRISPRRFFYAVRAAGAAPNSWKVKAVRGIIHHQLIAAIRGR